MARLYLVRHGNAVPGFEDEKRALSETGREEAENVGRFLRKLNITPQFIWHSELLRARETAELIATKLEESSLPLTERQGLRPESDALPWVSELAIESRSGLIVSHLPFLPTLISNLLTHPRDRLAVALPTGSLTCLERVGYGEWALRFLVTPQIIASV